MGGSAKASLSPPEGAEAASLLTCWFLYEGVAGLGVAVDENLKASFDNLLKVINGWLREGKLIHYCRGA